MAAPGPGRPVRTNGGDGLLGSCTAQAGAWYVHVPRAVHARRIVWSSTFANCDLQDLSEVALPRPATRPGMGVTVFRLAYGRQAAALHVVCIRAAPPPNPQPVGS